MDKGYDALNSADYTGALSEFDSALAELESSAPRFVEAKIGYYRAQAHADAEAAKQGFLSFANECAIRSEDYRTLVVDLTMAGAFAEATEVLKAGQDAHPEYEKWQELIDKVGDKAKGAGDEKTLKILEGMGYVGDG